MTQGLVTVQNGDRVLMKIIAGCDGDQAQNLARAIKRLWPVTSNDAYGIALSEGFGCRDCLVVVTDSDIIFEGEEEVDSLYRETFQQPRFNPRWKLGTADYVEVVQIHD